MKNKKFNRDILIKIILVVFVIIFFAFTVGLCFQLNTSALSSCNHQWTGGYCPVCGLYCSHPSFNSDDRCIVCNKGCTHSSYSDGKCTSCGYTCPHSTTYCEEGESSPIGHVVVCSTCFINISYYADNPHRFGNDPVCLDCGYVCLHSGFSGGKCITCGTSCPHPLWASGVCLTCGYDCDHLYGFTTDNPRKCRVCNSPCGHPSYSDGKCTACGGYCTHPSFSGGRCTVCELWCGHNFNGDNKCDICGGICTHEGLTTYEIINSSDHKYYCQRCKTDLGHYNHSFVGGSCAYCGFTCSSHSWLSNGSCCVCGTLCPHDEGYTTDNPRKCVICNAPCGHKWNGDDICDNCGGRCLHTGLLTEHGECTVCDWYCTHPFIFYEPSGDMHIIYCPDCDSSSIRDSDYHHWDGHKCYLCGYECPHAHYSKEDDGTVYCDLCGGYCDHTSGIATYTGGVCDNCGWACGHIFNDDNVCDECGGVCNHNGYLDDGICNQCGYVCPHSWVDGICNTCSLVCSHNFINDICSTCGVEFVAPPIDIEDGFLKLITAVYDAQINTFKSLLDYDLWGINIASFLITIVSIVVVFAFIKIIKRFLP